MENIETTISNLIKTQFPEHYREDGPLLIAFVENYYKWLESKSEVRDEWISSNVSLVTCKSNSANVIGSYTFFKEQLSKSDKIAICKDIQSNDYETFTVKEVSNNTFLTLTQDKLPNFSISNARYALISEKPNALFLTRNFFDLHDIDKTFDDYVIYFKEKYLKNIRFKTITNTRSLVKHSLDLYRSKGTERSIDLLYKIVFAKPAHVYYPSYDLFKLSSGVWVEPKYLELNLSPVNKKLINKQIVGILSGATAFVEEIIRSRSNNKIIEIAYISNIKGTFITGEKIILSDKSFDLSDAPIIIGSLNEILVDINGAGLGFEPNQIVDISSFNGTDATAKVLTVANTVGAIDYTLVDGGYGYANTIQLSNTEGSVSVSSACSSVDGTSTFFQRDYTIGDSISIWSGLDDYETHTVASISSNTLLSMHTPSLFTNTNTTAAYTRNFAQTFISEHILHLSNVTIDSAHTNFEYVNFLDSISQPLAQIKYVNANGVFKAGDDIFTYETDVVKGEGKVLFAGKTTLTSGILIVSIVSGDINEPAIYTTANAIGANLDVSSGYLDITASANVIGNYANVTITCMPETAETFFIGETAIQYESGARGMVVAVSTGPNNTIVLDLIDCIGMFKSGFEVDDISNQIQGHISGCQAIVLSATIDIGVINVNNAFLTYPGNLIKTSYLQGTVGHVSEGAGANVLFSTQLLDTEDITFNTDMIAPFLPLRLNTTWPFHINQSTDLSTVIADALSFANLTIGKAEMIVSTNPGKDYNRVPIVRLIEPTMVRFDIPDTISLSVANTVGFANGEIITQTNTNARGKLMSKNNDTLILQNMRFNAENSFKITNSIDTQIVGSDSGQTANVTLAITLAKSKRMGADITTSAKFINGLGAITSLKVLNSGVGFINGEQVTISSANNIEQAASLIGNINVANNTTVGFAVNKTHGTGIGYYKTKDGFLSDSKKLSDGYYYQEYSYEVRSGVIDRFKKELKNIVHTAGTKYFDALYYDSINNIEPNSFTTASIDVRNNLLLRDGVSFLLLRDGKSKLRLGYR